jgi:hypothetical protein
LSRFPISRQRLISDYNPGNEFRYRYAGDGFATEYGTGVNWQSLTHHRIFNDVVGTPKTQKVKPCSHLTVEYRGDPYQPFAADHGFVFHPLNGITPYLALDTIVSDPFLPVISHTQRVQFCGRAFTAFSERFPTKISGAEFVQGALEIMALLPKLEKDITRTIASGYLNKKFGWDNLLSDLNALSTTIDSIKRRMEFLKRTYGRPTKLNFREHQTTSDEELGQTWYWEPVRGLGTRLTLSSLNIWWNAGSTLVQRLHHIDDFIGWLRAIVISLGLNNPLLSIWQTTRLSFVVDWFANVSGHLARLAAVQPADEWNVYDMSHSVLVDYSFSVHQVNKNLIDSSDQEQFLGYLFVKRYDRYVGLPVDLTVFTPSTCTPDQLELLAAMAASK